MLLGNNIQARTESHHLALVALALKREGQMFGTDNNKIARERENIKHAD